MLDNRDELLGVDGHGQPRQLDVALGRHVGHGEAEAARQPGEEDLRRHHARVAATRARGLVDDQRVRAGGHRGRQRTGPACLGAKAVSHQSASIRSAVNDR